MLVLVLILFVLGCQDVPQVTTTTTLQHVMVSSTTTTTAKEQAFIEQARNEGSLAPCEKIEGFAKDLCVYEVLKDQINNAPDASKCDTFEGNLKTKCRDTWYYLNAIKRKDASLCEQTQLREQCLKNLQ